MKTIDLRHYPRGNRMVVRIAGEIDVHSAPALRSELHDLLALGENHLVLDMQHVEFLDSTGLAVLVGALRGARQQKGSIELVCEDADTLKIFQITGLIKVFRIHAKLSEVSPELPE